MISAVLILVGAVLAGTLSHFAARFLAARTFLPDRPNGRSSHRRVTPRAGGFAIFAGFSAGMSALLLFAVLREGALAADYAWFFAFAILAFFFGAVDDALALGARFKLVAQFVIAAGFAAIFGAVETLDAPFLGEVALGPAGYALTVLWIVAFMNVFNFMDGINGIAAACAMFVLSALAVAGAGVASVWTPPAIFLAAALFGFLPLNLPDGRIFMGDNGSQSIGFSIAALAALTGGGGDDKVSLTFAPLAFLPFIFDVAFTLAHRARRGCNVLAAHREHLYQLLLRLGLSHVAVTSLYLTLTALSATAALLLLRAPAPGQWFVDRKSVV